MPLVGNKAIFAIEWQITDKWGKSNQNINGHFCFWVNSELVGDYEDTIVISMAAVYIKEFSEYFAIRHFGFLEGKTKEEIFAYIYDTNVISPWIGETLEEASRRHDEETSIEFRNDFTLHSYLRRVFHLNDVGGTSFDWIGIILINDLLLNVQRLIWRDQRNRQLVEADLPMGYFDEVAQQFLAEYEKDTHLA